MFIKKRSIRIKRKIDGNTNFYSRCIDCDFKRFETINEEELNYLLKISV